MNAGASSCPKIMALMLVNHVWRVFCGSLRRCLPKNNAIGNLTRKTLKRRLKLKTNSRSGKTAVSLMMDLGLMMNITILAGSVTGNAHRTADALAEMLTEKGINVFLSKEPQASDLQSQTDAYLVITSTTGHGGLPYSMFMFANDCFEEGQDTDINGTPYGIIGLGNSNYFEFCAASEEMDFIMQNLNSKRVGDICKIDAIHDGDPIPKALTWSVDWLKLLGESRVC